MSKINIYESVSNYRKQLMGIAALWIIIFHFWINIFKEGSSLYIVESFIKTIGYCGVDIFLFLSGMGLVNSMEKNKNITSFYKARLKRILFPYLFISVINELLNRKEIKTFLLDLCGINFFIKDVNSSGLWFVIAIIVLYLLFPIYYYCAKKTNIKKYTIFLIAIWLLITYILFKFTDRIDIYSFTNRIPIFLLGAYFTFEYKNANKYFNSKKIILCLLVFILGIILENKTYFYGMFLLVPNSNNCIPNILITISMCMLLSYIFSLFECYLKYLLYCLSFIGDISLECYLLGSVKAQIILDMIFNITNSPLFTNLIFILYIISFSYMLHILNKKIIEKIA